MKKYSIGFLITCLLIVPIVYAKILVLQQGTVIGIYNDTEDITFSLYPDADTMKRIYDNYPVAVGEPDPTLTYPQALWGTTIPQNTVYVNLTASSHTLCLNCQDAFITITGEIRSSHTDEYTIVPVTSIWHIALQHEKGQIVVFLVSVHKGHFVGKLPANLLSLSGQWMLSDTTFHNLMLPEQLDIYQTYTGSLPENYSVIPYAVMLTKPFTIMAYNVLS